MNNPPTPSALSAEELDALLELAARGAADRPIGSHDWAWDVSCAAQNLLTARNQARTLVEPGDIEEPPDALAYVAMCMDPGDRKNTVNQAVEALRGFADRTPVEDGGAQTLDGFRAAYMAGWWTNAATPGEDGAGSQEYFDSSAEADWREYLAALATSREGERS